MGIIIKSIVYCFIVYSYNPRNSVKTKKKLFGNPSPGQQLAGRVTTSLFKTIDNLHPL